ncbi:MAG: AAA-like domain-containing protein [Fimbriimonadaceae bacterium]|nr:AAA-like domain-containing protein [Fimbriimonadaceae bacterium]
MTEHVAFFRPGGTLPPGTASYVPRRADDEIVEALLAGVYVFVLDSRQKGKSSLIVRSLDRLQQAGVTTVRIDLQRLGSNLLPEQWYAGLLRGLGQDLGLTGPLFDHWRANIEIGPVARLFSALEEVVLASAAGPIVVFVDEVDFVRSLPFSADEFFAAIRECYNRRSQCPRFGRLTFCLVGVAAPSQLIDNDDVTPFNIGRQVELTDFTREETAPYVGPLSAGGRDGERLLDRIHFWVSGHPYLTQLLAARIAADPKVRSPGAVDAVVRETLLGEDARHKEPNLADVERRLLEAELPGTTPEESRSRVLEAHGELLRNGLAPGRHDALLIATLRLSGVAIEESGKIRVRNRLYRVLFDERWRRANLPEAEFRRQRAASRRAAWRVGLVATMVVAAFAAMVVWLVVVASERDSALREARRLQIETADMAYASSIGLAAEQIEDGSFVSAASLLDSQRDYARKGWEWSYLSAVFGRARVLRPAIPGDPNRTRVIWWEGGLVEGKDRGICLNGRSIDAEFGFEGQFSAYRTWIRDTAGRIPLLQRIRLAKAARGQEDQPIGLSGTPGIEFLAHANRTGFDIRRDGSPVEHVPTAKVPGSLRLSPTGRFVAMGAEDGSPHLYDRTTKRWYDGFGAGFRSDDRFFTVLFPTGREPEVWRADGTVVCTLVGHLGSTTSLNWFADGKRLLSSGFDGSVRVWDAMTGRQLGMYLGSRSPLTHATLTEGERTVIALTAEGGLLEWDLRTSAPARTAKANDGEVLAGRLSPQGDLYATVGTDGKSAIFDVASGRRVATVDVGFSVEANPLAFCEDGKRVAYITGEGDLLIVEARTGRVVRRTRIDGRPAKALAIGPTGQIVVTLGRYGVATLAGPLSEAKVRGDQGIECLRAAISPDGRFLAVGSSEGRVAVLDASTLAMVRSVTDVKAPVRHLEWSHDGRWLAVTTATSYVGLFSMDRPGWSRSLVGHASRAWGARFTKDDKRLLTNSFDRTVRVWDTSTGEEIAVLQHPGWVSTAEWFPNDERIVTSCADGFVRVFNPRTGQELIKLKGHEGYAFDAEPTPDGATVVSTGADGTARFWRGAPR